MRVWLVYVYSRPFCTSWELTFVGKLNPEVKYEPEGTEFHEITFPDAPSERTFHPHHQRGSSSSS